MTVYTTRDLALLQYLKKRLDERGIVTFIRNGGGLGAAAGELAVCWPELCVADEADARAATRTIRLILDALQTDSGGPWRCPRCNEDVDAGFDWCWNCQAPRPVE